MTSKEKQKAIDALKTSAPVIAVTQEEFNDYIQTLNKIMDWLEQEPCDDAISRQAVVEHYSTGELAHCNHISRNNLLDFVEQLPPVTPQPKTGHWISRPHIYGVAFCSECGFELKINNTNYCPNCGFRMIDPQESEDK